MPIDRTPKSKGVLQHHVLGSVVEMLLRAQHVGDAHEFIINHHGKVIGWKSVCLSNDKVVYFASRQRGFP